MRFFQSNLFQRVVTAVVLLAVLVPTLFFATPAVFSALVLVLIAVAVWEWATLNGYKQKFALIFGLDAALIGLFALYGGAVTLSLPKFWLALVCIWVLVSAYLLMGGVSVWADISKALRMTVGFVLILAAWLAVAQLREIGINLLVSSLVLVFAADIGAYAAGRMLGGRVFMQKLSPSISPGKTWEGAMGGALSVMLIALLWLWLDLTYKFDSPSLYSLLKQNLGWLMWPVLVFTTVMCICGDLIESLVKRAAGVKDSSNLLPGHGGVLDRVDAILPMLPIAMLFASW